MESKRTDTYDVIIIGGGITGAGTARDCAMRGLKVLLIERNDIADGATGRNHGLLHSGARYAVKDALSAEECISENMILRDIAPHCVEDTQGLFITIPEDADCGYGLDYQEKFIEACLKAGIGAEKIDPREALRLEPSVNPKLIGAVKVPDGAVDPFKLCSANILDAKLHGAEILVYTEVLGFIMDGDAIAGVRTVDRISGEKREFRARMTVNAAGIWGQKIAAMAGAEIRMYPAKGALLVFAHRVNNVVINRCRKSGDGDILVPGDTVCVIGTTSTKVPFDECDDIRVTADEVDLLLNEGCKICPSLADTRILRAYGGVRPLVASEDDPTGRSISRGIVCLDHETRDGIRGLVTITGGKLMTYRLMAEQATDLVCSKIGVLEPCRTATTMLPVTIDKPSSYSSTADSTIICECENISEGQIRDAIGKFRITSLEDLRRRTRMGMGTCQGTFCAHRAAKILAQALGRPQDEKKLALDYLQERWKGMMPVGWGDCIREMEFMQKVYKAGMPSTFKK